jgi:hypothetical protein
MGPILRQRELILKLTIAIAATIVGVFLIVALVIVPSPTGASQTIKTTDRQVYLLGTSPNTEIILEQLSQGTSKVVQINRLSELPSNASDSMLFIDGQWPIGQPNATFSRTAAAIAPLILNGTPVVIIDGDDIVIQLAIEEKNISYGSFTSNPPATAPSSGLFYNQSTGCSSVFGCSTSDDHTRSVEYAVIRAYNWGSDLIAGGLPE